VASDDDLDSTKNRIPPCGETPFSKAKNQILIFIGLFDGKPSIVCLSAVVIVICEPLVRH